MADLQVTPTQELSRRGLRALRALFDEAFEGTFTDEDWDHTLGGVHVLAVKSDAIVAHAAVVERRLVVGDRALRAGYVESVATATKHRGRGHAATVMRAAGDIIRADYELGGLATDIPGFYERFGWELWRGPTYAIASDGPQRTPDDDGAVMVLRTPLTGELDTTAPLMCDWRSGDVW